ncbi:MAG TPA: regulatory protein RecX [Microlunatus sp.]
MSTSDPVDQARAWLEEKTGVRVPVQPAGDVEAAPQPVPGDRWGGVSGPDTPGSGGWSTGQSAAPTASGSSSSRSSWAGSETSRSTSSRSGSSGRRSSHRRSSGRRSFGSRSSGESADPAQAEPDADPVGTARTIALRKLTASARTRHELDQALQKKDVPDEVADLVLDRLEEVGLIDDEAFAQSWVDSRQQRRHLSRSALRRELQSKGVDRDHVDAALATVDAEDELEAARALAAKKASAARGLDPLVRDRRLAGLLARRGFGSGIIATVLAELRTDDGA